MGECRREFCTNSAHGRTCGLEELVGLVSAEVSGGWGGVSPTDVCHGGEWPHTFFSAGQDVGVLTSGVFSISQCPKLLPLQSMTVVECTHQRYPWEGLGIVVRKSLL